MKRTSFIVGIASILFCILLVSKSPDPVTPSMTKAEETIRHKDERGAVHEHQTGRKQKVNGLLK
jgi:hypothetical protein